MDRTAKWTPKTGVGSDDWRRKQAAGIARALAAGRYSGRAAPAREQTDEVLKLASAGVSAYEIAERLGIGASTTFRMLARARKAARLVVLVGAVLVLGAWGLDDGRPSAAAPWRHSGDDYVTACRRFAAYLDAQKANKFNLQCPTRNYSNYRTP